MTEVGITVACYPIDMDVIHGFLGSTKDHINDYLNEQNKHLSIESCTTGPSGVIVVPVENGDQLEAATGLDTIHEVTESSSLQGSIHATPETMKSSLLHTEGSIDLLPSPETMKSSLSHKEGSINAMPSPEPPVQIEYEQVFMIQMSRNTSSISLLEKLPLSISYLHRTVFFNSETVSKELMCPFIDAVNEEEQGNAALLSSFYQPITEDKDRDFHCNWSITFIWSLDENSETVGESRLFSSWKTKINRISRDVLKCEAVGFVDLCENRMNIYQWSVCSINADKMARIQHACPSESRLTMRYKSLPHSNHHYRFRFSSSRTTLLLEMIGSHSSHRFCKALSFSSSSFSISFTRSRFSNRTSYWWTASSHANL